MVKLYAKDKERIAKLKQSEAGRRFLRRKCKRVSTTKLYVRGVFMFVEWFDKGIPEIVAEYQADADKNLYKAYDKWELIFEDYADYLKEKYPKGASAATYFEAAVGLINANVPSSAEIHPKLPEAPSRSVPPITIEDLRTVRNIADERERAFIDVLKDTGISRADAVGLTYKDVKKTIENPNIQYYKIDVYRGKENVEYETWLGPNAIQSLRIYFGIRERLGEKITDETWIFTVKGDNQPLEPPSLSAVFRRLSRRTGIKISTHKLRKLFETYITAGGTHPIVAKYWMGHKIKTSRDIEAAYIIPPENVQREQYMKAYDKIDLEATSLAQLQKRQQIVEELQGKIMAGERLTQEDFAKAKRHNIRFVTRLRRYPEKAAKATEDCPNGEHCGERFEEIGESDLLQHLRLGWQVVHRLENGRVIVKR